MGRGGRWILDLDISNYFGTIDHRELRAVLDKTVKDGLVRRLIDKWLKRRDGLRRLTWAKFNRILERLALPEPRIVHTFGWRP